MQYFDIGFWAVLGLITGSFVNVCLDRFPLQFADEEKCLRLLGSPKVAPFLKQHIQDQSLNFFKPARSFCFSCGHQLQWFENIPVLSFLLNIGRCRKCKSAFGLRTIWIETTHGLWYAVVGWLFQGWILPLCFSINFSFLLILGYCWTCHQVRKILFFVGVVLVGMNYCLYFFDN